MIRFKWLYRIRPTIKSCLFPLTCPITKIPPEKKLFLTNCQLQLFFLSIRFKNGILSHINSLFCSNCIEASVSIISFNYEEYLYVDFGFKIIEKFLKIPKINSLKNPPYTLFEDHVRGNKLFLRLALN